MDLAAASMTPREQAEAAWTPTSPYAVDKLEQLIRADRDGRPTPEFPPHKPAPRPQTKGGTTKRRKTGV